MKLELGETMAKHLKNAGRQYSKCAETYVSNGKLHALKREDVKTFATAADKYVAAHVTSEKKARSALHKMGIITPTGRLSKHYK